MLWAFVLLEVAIRLIVSEECPEASTRVKLGTIVLSLTPATAEELKCLRCEFYLLRRHSWDCMRVLGKLHFLQFYRLFDTGPRSPCNLLGRL